MKQSWEKDAIKPSEYHAVKVRTGREFLVRLTTGADVYLAIQKFAKDKNIRFAKIHCSFMGGFQPAVIWVWTPDPNDPNNWHNESAAKFDNLSMVISMNGIIHPRIMEEKEEPFPAIHFAVGGAWDVPTTGGHLGEGTIVKGVCEVFITELLGIDLLFPSSYDPTSDTAPENWYKEVK